MSELNIDWSKIVEPIQFFGLQENFEESELKKAYKSYIKVYKPDLFPEEFKKIRKAYEGLLNRLAFNRYEKEIEEIESSKNISLEIKNETVEVTPPDVNLEDLSAIKKYLENAPLNAKTCLSWAVYSDLVPEEKDHFYWLAKGVQFLEANDYYYSSYINLFVKSTKASEDWLPILQSFASSYKAESFYYFLYPIFSQIINDLPAEKVVECLVNCEKKLIYVGDYIQTKIELYLMLLRKCVWECKSASSQHLFDFLISHQSSLHDDQFSELEFNQNLKKFFEFQDPVILQNQLCVHTNQLIYSFVVNDEEKCRVILLEIKKYLEEDLSYDPLYESQLFNEFCDIQCKIVDYIIFEIGHILIFKDFSDKLIINNAIAFNEMVEKTYAKSLTYQAFWFLRILFCAPPFFLIVLYVILLNVLLIVGYFLLPKFKIMFLTWEYKIDEKLYKKKLCRKSFDFIFQNKIMMDQIAVLPQIYADPKKIENTRKLYERMTKIKIYEFHDLFAKITTN